MDVEPSLSWGRFGRRPREAHRHRDTHAEASSRTDTRPDLHLVQHRWPARTEISASPGRATKKRFLRVLGTMQPWCVAKKTTVGREAADRRLRAAHLQR